MIWYILYHLFNGFETRLETTPAVLATKEIRLTSDGYVVRSEKLITCSESGGVNYLYPDGEKVRAGSVVADVYSGDAAAGITEKMIEIDKQIAVLKESSFVESRSSSDADLLDKQIKELYYVIRDKLEDGDLEYVTYKRDELLVLLNKRAAVSDDSKGFEELIEQLQKEREELSSGLDDISEEITVPTSGYFYSTLDGYENVFTPSRLTATSYEAFDKMLSSKPEPIDSKSVGKYVDSDEWYLISILPIENLKLFEVGKKFKMKFPYNEDVIIDMTLTSIQTDPASGKAALVFKTMVMPDGFKYLRKQTVEIIEASYTGYKVPVSAVRNVDGNDGVYVLNGNIIRFKLIDIITDQDGYYIVKQQLSYLDDKDYAKKLGLYEMIIVSGKDLYDGKIVKSEG